MQISEPKTLLHLERPENKQQAIWRTGQHKVSADGQKAKIHWTHMEKKTRIGMPDAHVGTKAGNKKNRKASNEVCKRTEK